MSSSQGNSNKNNTSNKNHANFPQFAGQPQGQTQQRWGNAQQQRLMQMQQQRSQQQMQSKQHGNPLAPAPASLTRPPPLTSASSSASLLSNKGSSPSKAKGMAPPKPTTLGRGVSSTIIPPPPSLKAATSSIGALAAATRNEAATNVLLSKSDWVDKTIWVSRQLLGGNINNGFLSATSNVQRLKRQRARQAAHSQKKKDEDAAAKEKEKDPPKETPSTASSSNTASATAAGGGKEAATAASKDKDGGKKRDAPDQAAEESLKKEIMNTRTAKKLKAELEVGIQWCVTLQNAIRSILTDMDPAIAAFTPLPLDQGGTWPKAPPNTTKTSTTTNPASMALATISSSSATTSSPNPKPSSPAPPVNASPPKVTSSSSPTAPPVTSSSDAVQRRASDNSISLASLAQSNNNNSNNTTTTQKKKSSKNNSTAPQATPGGPAGSTLRKHRKKKLPASTEPTIPIAEFDATGKRICSKKEHQFRIFEVTRFRALKEGDFVAARVSSRDLWILARVQADYPGFGMPPNDFLNLTEAKRDAHFKEKAAIKDVEDKEGVINRVPRNLVLPLPRTFSEAAEWCQRSKKGSRVYAMYPQTTSLYSATVVDNTTYCRGDDDIIVVEFDGDEADHTGVLPKYHIPARFVTLIPREFPAAQTNSKKRKSATQAQANTLPDLASPSSVKSMKSEGSLGGSGFLEDGLGGLVDGMGFDDLVTTDSLEDFGFDFSEA
ncbi:expressed unknown protein [Seminavis robusta]|uniref:SGF29 C-terminal domain-containing protein n=1 Tax=Seminavis robusta TaxID=568900 RepID=A0A9N8HCH8_9STRA|nr:expressed unknown protein [Seminavis robusta]|eukprot:Sro382_g131150.1 n/a (720) ;mRNA; f:55036-57420